MATTTTATVREKLAKRLLDLRIKNAKVYKEDASLRASLIAEAEKLGEKFKFFEANSGSVSVSPPKDSKGLVAIVDQQKFLALTDAQRAKLTDGGLITLEPTRAYSGAVTVKLF
jgi:hypothetical protein